MLPWKVYASVICENIHCYGFKMTGFGGGKNEIENAIVLRCEE